MSLRVLVAVTHLVGAGHLTRAAAIGRALAEGGDRVTLLTGGRPISLVSASGLQVVQLPPVQASADDFSTLRDEEGQTVGPDYMNMRMERLLDALHRAEPDVVITELFPFGRRSLGPEFTSLVEAADRMRPRPLLLCSVRDILVAPARRAKVERSHALIERYYGAVLVHGDPDLVPLEASWPVDATLRSRLIYTGYVDGGGGAPARPTESAAIGITVSGGSSAAALPLYAATIGAAKLLPEQSWRILVGHGVDGSRVAELREEAGPNVVIEPARSDFRDILRGSAMFVGQAGYNTVVDLLATRTRAVLVPFERGQETEQRLRAEHLRDRGLATLLPESELSAARLAELAARALGAAAPPLAAISCDGAARTAVVVRSLAAGRHRARTVSRELGT